MKIITQISELIEDELEGAEEYIKCALKHREDNPKLASVLYEISVQEMHHVNMLHAEVAEIIQKHRREHGEPPTAMQAVYDYLHEKHIEEAAKIKAMQAHYREMPEHS